MTPQTPTNRRLTKIEKEIKEYTERNHDTLIPASCMRRVIHELLGERKEGMRITREAQRMIQTEAESMLTDKFRVATKIAGIARRETILASDMRMVDTLSE